jgi:hypothetical protein
MGLASRVVGTLVTESQELTVVLEKELFQIITQLICRLR